MATHYPPGPKTGLMGLSLAKRFQQDPLSVGIELAQTPSDLVH